MQQMTSKTCPGTSPCYRSTCSACAQVELSLEHSAMLNCSLEFSVFSLPYLSCRKWQGSSAHVWHHMLPLRHVIDNREGRHTGFERASWMASVDRSFLDGKRSERSLCSVKGREVIWKSRGEGSVSQRETGEALSCSILPLRLWAPCTNLGAKHSSCQCSVFSDFSPWLVISACALNGGNCVCYMRLLVQELRTAEVKLEPIKLWFFCSPALQKGK